MAIIRKMFKKAESPVLADLRELDRKRAERIYATWKREQSLKNKNHATKN